MKTLEEKVKGVHEVNELHEMLTFKNVCMKKSAVMASVAQDPALKNLLQQDIKTIFMNISYKCDLTD